MQQRTADAIKKYGFEFLTIFIGVFAAFALDSWNSDRKDHNTETRILSEIRKGLKQDLQDLAVNVQGHKVGLAATAYFGRVLLDKPFDKDSVPLQYIFLTRSFISVQNIAGYETLKSKGLDIISNDSLRTEILSVYENDYNTLRKLEESYPELQFHTNFHVDFDHLLAPNFILDNNGSFKGIAQPLKITEKDKKILLTDMMKINSNRNFMVSVYAEVEKRIRHLHMHLDKVLKSR